MRMSPYFYLLPRIEAFALPGIVGTSNAEAHTHNMNCNAKGSALTR